jgi:hypothetical protein
VACETPRALIDALGADATVRATVTGGRIDTGEVERLRGVVSAEVRGEDGRAALALRTTDAQATLIDLLALAERASLTLSGLSTTQATLEDVFLARTGHEYEGDGVMG